MAVGGFSKVNIADLDSEDDEEEEHRKVCERGRSEYKAAEERYSAGGSLLECLELFEEAEQTMAPAVERGGLLVMGPEALKDTLRGRLYHALVLAHVLEHGEERWDKVKWIAEGVLEYDHGNKHARFLRVLSVGLGAGGSSTREREEALEEVQRFVERERAEGHGGQAGQWAALLQRIGLEVTDLPKAEQQMAESQSDASAPSAAAGSKKRQAGGQKVCGSSASSAAEATAAAATAAASAAGAGATAASKAPPAGGQQEPAASSATSPPAATELYAEVHKEMQELLREQRRQLDRQGEQVDELQRRLLEEQGKQEEDRLASASWRRALEDGLLDHERTLASEVAAVNAAALATAAETARAREAARSAAETQRAARTWAEGHHQRYLDVSTEVLTLQKLLAREHRERQDASKMQVVELRDLTKRLGEIKAWTKALRDNVRQRVAGEPPGDDEELDMQQMAQTVADFHGLPFKAKVAILLDDALVLKLAFLMCCLGMLLTLSGLVEGFGHFRCRVVCAQ